MKILLFLFIILTLALESLEYDYSRPHQTQVLQPPTHVTKTIKGNYGKQYQVTVSGSTNVYEVHLPPAIATQQPYAHPRSKLILQSYPGFGGSFQQPPVVATDNNKHSSYNQFASTSNQQLPQQQTMFYSYNAPQQQQIYDTLSQMPQLQGQQQQQPLQSHPQQYENCLQQPLSQSNLPDSNTLLNDLLNNNIYVSQSEAAQLNVYPYTQTNADPRPFTLISSICSASGQCQQQQVVAGSNHFQHKQVLKQSKAKLTHQLNANTLTKQIPSAKTPKWLPINKGTDLRERRLFCYTEFVLPHYPHN